MIGILIYMYGPYNIEIVHYYVIICYSAYMSVIGGGQVTTSLKARQRLLVFDKCEPRYMYQPGYQSGELLFCATSESMN